MNTYSSLARALVVTVIIGLCTLSLPVRAAELIMFESTTCEWCQRWHEEIGPVYPKTREAECAPLRIVDISEPRPQDIAWIKGVRFTPTFVIVENAREVGRVVGYPGDEFFWFLLEEHLAKLSETCPS